MFDLPLQALCMGCDEQCLKTCPTPTVRQIKPCQMLFYTVDESYCIQCIYNRELLASVVPEYSISRWVEFGLNLRSLGWKFSGLMTSWCWLTVPWPALCCDLNWIVRIPHKERHRILSKLLYDEHRWEELRFSSLAFSLRVPLIHSYWVERLLGRLSAHWFFS